MEYSVFFTFSLVYCYLASLIGLSSGQHSSLMVGGRPVDIEQYPFVVAVLEHVEVDSDELVHKCGGAILTSYYVLTAAQCISDVPLRIRAGSSYHSRGGSLHRAVTAELHPDHASGADIAVLGLATPIVLNHPAVGQAPLPFQDMEVNIGMNSFIVGWSSDSLSSEPSMSLQMGVVAISPREQCESAYASLSVNVSALQLCAFASHVDFCVGGLGSPLFSAGVVVGVAAYTLDCGVTSVPSVYTQTSRFTSWIQSIAIGQPRPS